MKQLKYFAMAALMATFAACSDDEVTMNNSANVTVELTNDTVIKIAEGAFTGVSNVKVPSQLLSEYRTKYPEFAEKFII